MPIRLHCNELRALCLTTNALCRTAEFSALLLKCVLIVYIWPEKRCSSMFYSSIDNYPAHGRGGRLSAPLRFFADSEKTAARSAAKFA